MKYVRAAEAAEIISQRCGMPLAALVDIFADIPPADVKPVTYGCWMPVNESEITGWNPEFAGRDPIGGFECSHCGEEAILNCNDKFVLSDYCPNCGAKMDGEDE